MMTEEYVQFDWPDFTAYGGLTRRRRAAATRAAAAAATVAI